MANYIKWFRDLSKADVKIAGGKGANLGELYVAGFPVPPGFVITTNAYDDFIHGGGIAAQIEAKLKTISLEDTAGIRETAKEIQALFMGPDVPENMKEEIINAYHGIHMGQLANLSGKAKEIVGGLGKETPFVAVRSSATAEDIPEASFAGLQASFMNVRGADELIESVRKCWASLFTGRAIYYREKNNFEHMKVSLSVVVQKQINSSKSGIIFSINPVTNDKNQIVMNAGWGLGDAIVGGQVIPDEYIIEKDTEKVLEKIVKKQTWKYTREVTTGKTVKKAVDKKLQEAQVLTDKEIQLLAKLAKKVEKHYKFPQDMEWAIENRRVFLVQSRPVTTLEKRVPPTPAEEPSLFRPTYEEEKPVEKEPWEKPEEEKPSYEFKPVEEVVEEPERYRPPEIAKRDDEPYEKIEFPHEPVPSPAPEHEVPQEIEEPLKGEPILQGFAASKGTAYGPVKIIRSMSELAKIEHGDILVTQMTNPDMVPAMEKAAAIVTDEGGVTSHAAIVSRELGIPCIVGTDTATEMLQDDDYVTVDATNGMVYRGKVELESLKEEEPEPTIPTYGEEALERPAEAPAGAATATKVKVNLDLPEAAERAAATRADGIGLFRLEMLIATKGVHPAQFIRTGRTSEYVNLLVEGIEKVARAFKDKPIWVRTSDLRTDEYRNLEGGDQEPHESNPMLGLHGIRRALKDPDILRAEFVAIKQLHERGYKKIGVMLPFVINVSEVREAKRILREVGLEPRSEVEFGVMVETPACVGIIEDLCKEGIDFVSFGTNDLTQLVLGIDRNNEQLQHLWDEMHPGVLEVIKKVIDVCKRYNVETSICGQAGSRTDMAEWLVNKGISSISANIDAVSEIRNTVFAVERKILLEAARKREF